MKSAYPAISRDDIDAAVANTTFCSSFLATVDAHPDAIAIRYKQDDVWHEVTYLQLANEVAHYAYGIGQLGFKRGDRIALMLGNRYEFHVADLAILFCGLVPVSIYYSSSPAQIRYAVNKMGARAAILDGDDYADRFAQVRMEMPTLDYFYTVDESARQDGESFASLRADEQVDLHKLCEQIVPDDLITIIFTSGTTGNPKGVMLTHRNICWTIESYRNVIDFDLTALTAVSYLPLAHIAERMTSYYLAHANAMTAIPCPEPRQLADYLREVRPATLFGVPRIWEKVKATVDGELSKKLLMRTAVNTAISANTVGGSGLSHALFGSVTAGIRAKVRESLGLDQAKLLASGAAPIAPELMDWLRALELPISEVYGLSETCGPLIFSPQANKAGFVGRPMPGVELKLAEDGELLARGGSVFIGYLDDVEKTDEVLNDGWFHTGDIAQIDDDGFVAIVDRKKELIVTSGGKNISPANLEAALTTHPLISSAAVIGDARPFLSCLVVLDPIAVRQWAKRNRKASQAISVLCNDRDLTTEIARQFDSVNSEVSKVEGIKKWTILDHEWAPDSELLTPTLKLRRKRIAAIYSDEIEAMYER